MARNRTGTVVFTVRGPIERRDLPGLRDRICALLDSSGASTAFCEVENVAPDAVTADALARLQLAARRCGCQVRLRGASPELRSLIAFMGLADVLPEETLDVDSRRQPE
jgi:hypothetical protein